MLRKIREKEEAPWHFSYSTTKHQQIRSSGIISYARLSRIYFSYSFFFLWFIRKSKRLSKWAPKIWYYLNEMMVWNIDDDNSTTSKDRFIIARFHNDFILSSKISLYNFKGPIASFIFLAPQTERTPLVQHFTS